MDWFVGENLHRKPSIFPWNLLRYLIHPIYPHRGEALVSFIPGFINSEQRTMGYSHHLLLVLNQLITNYWL